MIKNTIREFYLLSALGSASMGIITATYVTFLLQNGLNLFEVNLVNFVFFTTLFLCEIPTGAFADVFGRKASYIVSCALMTTGMLTYAVSNTFTGFAIAEAISAIGATFASGAFKAWFVDKLHHHGYTEKLNPVFAKATQIKQATGIASALLGAYLADISACLPWVMGAALFVLTGLIACFLKEEYFVPQKFSLKDGFAAMKQTVRSSIQYGLQSKNVRFILVIVSVQIFAVQAPNMEWQPFFGKDLSSETDLGFVWTGMALSRPVAF